MLGTRPIRWAAFRDIINLSEGGDCIAIRLNRRCDLPATAISGEEPFDDIDWDGLGRGDEAAQHGLVERLGPPLRAKLQASLPAGEAVADAEEETFKRVFQFFLGGHQCRDLADLTLFIDAISRNVILERQRAEKRIEEYRRSVGNI